MLTGCDFLNGSSNYTPSIELLRPFITQNSDTLYTLYDTKTNHYRLDTIQVGDTVSFAIGYSSYTNHLVSTTMEWDKEYVELRTIIGMGDSVLKPTSDTTHIRLDFQNGYNYAAMSAKFIPLKAGKSTLYFSVQSDAEKIANTNEVSIDLVAE